MTINGVTSSALLALSLLSLLTKVALCAPALADHQLEIHLTEWKTLPTGERVSCPEKMRRSRMESWRRRSREASIAQLTQKLDAVAIASSRGRRLIALNTTNPEVNALLAFRSSILSDPTGALANWTIDRNASYCSTWKGVTCDETEQVARIDLRDLGLNGTVTPMIGDLVDLSFLNLSGNSLWGPIPSELMRCQNLVVVDLSSNSLDGKVSPEFFTMPKLEWLRLSNNRLSGPLPEVAESACRSMTDLRIDFTYISGAIPSSLSRCQNLTVLSLINNLLDGSIPSTLGELHQLEQLWLYHNKFTGPIPSQLGSLKKLVALDLHENSIEGQIPPSLGMLSQLQLLHLKNNQLTGSIPPSLANCSSLLDLLLGYNYLTGTIPEEFGNLSSIIQIGLEFNWNLTGSVPGFLSKCSKLEILFLGACNFTSIDPEIWSMKSLVQLALFSNNISGELPMEVGNCTSLDWLDLGWFPNELTGSIPPTLGMLKNLTTLSLMMNLFTGGIPPELGNLPQLETLWLGRNEGLSGHIPSKVSNLTTLVDVDLGNCNLTGTIPDDLFINNPNLKRVLLNDNNFNGRLPDGLGTLQHLETLYLQFNRFNGRIPSDIGGCLNLKDILLSNNELNGTIPASIGQLLHLEATLDLSSNSLSGNIPVELGNLNKLQRLVLSTNRLNGTIPNELGGCASLQLFDLSSNGFTGDIPKFLGNLSNLTSLDLSNNMLSDDVAALATVTQCTNMETLRVGQNMMYGALQLDFTKWAKLKYFSVGDNRLTGEIPPTFASINSSLVLVDFSRNRFAGQFPAQVDSTYLYNLRVLLFSHNEFEGTIPSWFGNLKSLQVLDLSYNKLTGSIPQNIGNLDGYKVQSNGTASSHGAAFTLNQRLNLTLGGGTVEYSYILQATTHMDLSSNALQGEMPVGITDLVALKYLTLSNNKLEGQIWTDIQKLKSLETLDLSQNNLSGPIPSVLPSFVSLLNVSLNNLSGPIPTGGQFDTFSETYYLPGNPGLCGNVINRPCGGHQVDLPSNYRLGVSDYMSIPGFGIGAASGFFIVGVTLLAWAPARLFVLGTTNKRKATSKVHGYGIFNPKF